MTDMNGPFDVLTCNVIRKGTSENLGKKLSLHGNLTTMRNPDQSIRNEYSNYDWGPFPLETKVLMEKPKPYPRKVQVQRSNY